MKLLLAILFFWVAESENADLRRLYEHAPTDERKATELIHVTEKNLHSNAIMLGYNGAAKMIMANHTWNVLAKWQYFTEGRKLLEQAIDEAPDNAELHYLRLTIQLNIPKFLGYHEMIEADKIFLKENFKQMDGELQKMIRKIIEIK